MPTMSWFDKIKLWKSIQLSLKGDQFVVQDYVSDNSFDTFFEEIGLDTELSPKDTVEMLPKCP